jgi:hypothetical protein
MFRTTIKALSLFRKNSNYRYSYSGAVFRKNELLPLYCDSFNMFILSAFVKESTNNTNNTNNTNSEESKCSENYETELKLICQITGCEKNKNNKDSSCEKICIVTKS